MAAQGLRTLLRVLEVIRPALTRPGFGNALVVFAGWVLTGDHHAVTQALVVTNVAARRDWSSFHRFFSRGSWAPDVMGGALITRLLTLIPPDEPIRAVIDDTLAAKKGPHVFGIGSHLDAVRSTKSFRVFCFGHVWVTLAIAVQPPFSHRTFALPVLFRLYRNKKECAAKRHTYRKKTELARDMLDVLARHANGRRVHVTMDSAYSNDTVLRRLPSSVAIFGAMRADAALTAAPPIVKARPVGRPRVKGLRLPSPEALARNHRHKWLKCRANLYGQMQTVRYKTMSGQWYRACGAAVLRIVIVRVDHGAIAIRVFFCTDMTLSVSQILEGYGRRWAIEVCFRDLKQLLGFADSSARKKEAVERTAPFVGFTYSLLVIWFIEGAHTVTAAAVPVRPWYRHKRGLCFADILRAARAALAPLDVLDPGRGFNDLPATPRRTSPPRAALYRRAA